MTESLYICDICKKEIARMPVGKPGPSIYDIPFVNPKGEIGLRHVHLCHDCEDKLAKYIEGLKKTTNNQ